MMKGCQRWRSHRASYRPAGEPIDTSRYGVELIEGDNQARAFVEAHHYSASYPAARLKVGLYRTQPGPVPTGAQLVGVAVFSVPMQARAIPARCGVPAEQGVELGRLVLLDDVQANGETWFLARARRALRFELPQVRAILSYSDPVARTRADGTCFKAGHVGTIYQAFGGTYVGRSSARTLYLDPQGRAISGRTLSKLRQQDKGQDYAAAQLEELGVPRLPGESGASWVRRALATLRPLRHPGNHAYIWRMDNHQIQGLAYPKQPDTSQACLF